MPYSQIMDEKCGHGLKRFQLLSEHNLFGKSKVQQAYPNLVANTFQQVISSRCIESR